jgi:hypothetical protein
LVVAVAVALAWHIAGRPAHTTQDYVAEATPLYVAATLAVSVVLAWITGYYARANRQMVVEMRSARELSVRPHFALELHHVGPTFVDVRLHNVGPGTATDLDLTVTFIGRDVADDARPLRTSVLLAGSHHEFLPPRDVNSAEALVLHYSAVRMAGVAHDAYGSTLRVVDEIADLKSWLEAVEGALIRWERPPVDAGLDLLTEATKHLRTIAGELERPGNERRSAELWRTRRRRRLRSEMQKRPVLRTVEKLYSKTEAWRRRLFLD